MAQRARRVGSILKFELDGPATLHLQIAVAAPTEERLEVRQGERRLETHEVRTSGGRIHVVDAPAGPVDVAYEATVGPDDGEPRPVSEAERIEALRPSRYCPSDELGGFAARQFDFSRTPTELLSDVVAFVGGHLVYTAGASGPTDTAVDTLLAGAGVCRDYAHLTATLLRAVDIPARVVAVYAPGLWPMDFHAVVEADIGGGWRVVDATGLSSRPALARIAHGRDAADTAFVTTFGLVRLLDQSITAVIDGDLPIDDGVSLVSLA
jgi:transglutaminase-like putative cysteine protease